MFDVTTGMTALSHCGLHDTRGSSRPFFAWGRKPSGAGFYPDASI